MAFDLIMDGYLMFLETSPIEKILLLDRLINNNRRKKGLYIFESDTGRGFVIQYLLKNVYISRLFTNFAPDRLLYINIDNENLNIIFAKLEDKFEKPIYELTNGKFDYV